MPTVSELISQILLKKLREEELTPEESAALAEWENRSPEHRSFVAMLLNEAALSEKIKNMLEMDEQAPWQRIERALEVEWNDRTTVPKRKNSWYKYAAVITVVLLAGLAVFYFTKNKPVVPETAKVQKADSVADFFPAGNRATLTLSDSTPIELEAAPLGLVTDREGARVVKTQEGKLLFERSTNAVPNAGTQNVLTTPRGGRYQVELADGTKVWLNAGSSLKFPVDFTAMSERKVEVRGEAYFEVAKDQHKKFIARINSSRGDSVGEVEVLGTHFNIMAYDEENIVATTLLEGRVKMVAYKSVGLNTRSLLPGQQAAVDEKGWLTVKKVDTESVMGWKNNDFHIEADNLAGIFREISRWYNIKIFNESALPKSTFTGIITRNQKLSQILRVLESDNLHFQLKGDSLTILP